MNKGRYKSGSTWRLEFLPAVGEEFFQASGGVGGDPLEYIFQAGKRFDPIFRADNNQADQDRRRETQHRSRSNTATMEVRAS